MPNPVNLGVLLAALGGMLQGSFALPMKRMERRWRWENTWLIYSIVGLIIFPCALALFTIMPPQWVERLPSVCINHHLFGWCPGCGSLRALVRLFHGDVAGAARFNVNVLFTAPLLVGLLVSGVVRSISRRRRLD